MAPDVAKILGFNYTLHMMRVVDGDEKGVHLMDTRGGKQKVSTLNESGLYAVIIRSDKPSAKRFRKWVTSEVLPSIRKTGHYQVQPQQMQDPMLQAMVDTFSAVVREIDGIKAQQAKLIHAVKSEIKKRKKADAELTEVKQRLRCHQNRVQVFYPYWVCELRLGLFG